MIYTHGIDGWKTTIKAVKDKYQRSNKCQYCSQQ